MLNRLNNKSLSQQQILYFVLCFSGILFSSLLFFPYFENGLLGFAEKLLHRPLTRNVWLERFSMWRSEYLFAFTATGFLLIILNCFNIYIQNLKTETICKLIAFISFIFMFLWANHSSLWLDELFTVKWSAGSILDNIYSKLKFEEAAPPLFGIISTIWYHIAPYGERYLLLVSIIPITASIYIVGLIGNKAGGKISAVYSSLFLSISYLAWTNGAWEFRPYAYMVLFSSLSVYFFILRNENKTDFKYKLIYSICLVFLAMTHYFGMIAVLMLFLCGEIYLLIKKETNFKTILEYFPAGILSLIWFAILILYGSKNVTTNLDDWYPIPQFGHFRDMIMTLAGGNHFAFIILILSIFYSIAMILLKCAKKTKSFQIREDMLFLANSVILLTLAALFLYGNIRTSKTMWQDRYFMSLLPFTAISCGIFVETILSITKKKFLIHSFVKFLCILFFMTALFYNTRAVYTYKQANPYREAAIWLQQQNDVTNKDVIITATADDLLIKGWNEYYITHQGKLRSLNICSIKELIENKNVYQKIYVNYSHYGITDELKQYLDGQYILTSEHPDIQINVYERKINTN